MIRPRIIPSLLLRGKGLVKTIQFKNPIYLGDPLNTFNIFNKKMVDEIIISDIEATAARRQPNFELIKRISSICFSPLTYGGGVNNLIDADRLFSIGIEKICINTSAFKKPTFVTELAKKYGSQSVVVSVNINRDFWGKKRIVNNSLEHIDLGGKSISEQMKIFEDLGAGELLINDVNRDGTFKGYDIDLIKNITSQVTVPVIASGGCGSYSDLKEVILDGGAAAAAAGSIFVFNGPHKAVLISYPEREIIKKLLT
jgi:imidazole glycerol-phosphate synthase subunit HisF